MKRFAFAVFACLLACGASPRTIPQSAEHSQPSTAEQQNERPAQAQSPSTSPQPDTGKAEKIVTPANESRASEQKHDRESNYPEWLSKLFSDLKITDLVIAIFTAGLTIYTARLWRSTEKLWTAGERQLAVTERALNHAADTAERQLRAYVLCTSAELKSLFPRQKPDATLIIKNTGQTPAYDLVLWGGIRWEAYPPASDIFPERENFEPIRTVIAAGHTTWIRVDTKSPISDEVFYAIRAKEAAVYVWGKITYRDAFSRERQTVFRFVYDTDRKLFTPLETGNEAD